MAQAPAIVRAERIADQVYRTLRRAILIGQYAPGARLREVELAASLNTSRTACSRGNFQADRETASSSNSRTAVSKWPIRPPKCNEVADTAAEMYEIYVIREALESSAGRLAAARITERELEELDRLAKKTAQIPLEILRNGRDSTPNSMR